MELRRCRRHRRGIGTNIPLWMFGFFILKCSELCVGYHLELFRTAQYQRQHAPPLETGEKSLGRTGKGAAQCALRVF